MADADTPPKPPTYEDSVLQQADVPVGVAGKLEHAPALDLVALVQEPGVAGEADEGRECLRLVPQLLGDRLREAVLAQVSGQPLRPVRPAPDPLALRVVVGSLDDVCAGEGPGVGPPPAWSGWKCVITIRATCRRMPCGLGWKCPSGPWTRLPCGSRKSAAARVAAGGASMPIRMSWLSVQKFTLRQRSVRPLLYRLSRRFDTIPSRTITRRDHSRSFSVRL